jgi:hypothetical protein
MADEKLDRVLDEVDPDKREFLKKVLVGTAFTAPIVASFSMDALGPREAFAQAESPNVTLD